MILSLLPPSELERVLEEALSEDAFLSPHGLRALSRRHLAAAVPDRGRGLPRIDRLRARRVDDGPVRRQLELARPGLVPGQLPVHRVAAPLGRGARRRVHGRVPDRVRAPDAAARRGRRPVAPPRLDLAPGRRRPPPGRRLDREVPRRPRVARPAAVPRVLPRRHRGRASAPRTRPAGRASSPTCWCRGGPLDRNAIPDGEPAP